MKQAASEQGTDTLHCPAQQLTFLAIAVNVTPD